MTTQEVSKIANGNAKFANKLYELLAKENPGENIFFSPISAHTVLSMVYQGAAGTTAQCLASGLNMPDTLSTAKGYNGVINNLNNIQNVTLHVANKIFVMENFPLKAAFKQATSDLFLSEAQSVNFGANAETANIINQWVENKTNSKIQDLIKPEFLNALTRLVLVNAVYFKGNWADKFDKDDTKTEPFHVTKDQTVDCQMMHITKKYMYCDDKNLDAKILEIPYDSGDVNMLVILPNAVDGIEALEKKLVNVDLSKLTVEMDRFEVVLSLPKFKMEVEMDLESILTKMGMGEIFSESKADFSGITDRPEQLYVSKAIQKAFIEVNEGGTEAAAATDLSLIVTPEITNISTGNAKFANKVYKILAKKKPSANIFFSPLSAHAVLSLVYQGAAGTTATSLASALYVLDKLSTAKGYNGVINTLNNIENVTLCVANKIFILDHHPLKAEFKKTTFDLFLSEAEMVNFCESEEAATIINQWVEDKTNSKIKDVIKPECLNGLTRLVLVNAVYFKGNWVDQFHKLDTLVKPFHVTKNKKVDCQMMHITKKYMYRNDTSLDAQIIILPYGKKDISMVVILPNAVDGIENLESKLYNADLSKLTEGTSYVQVTVYLPKFKMEVNIDFESILTKMGMGEIFNPNKADFSEISDSSEGLYRVTQTTRISTFFQKREVVQKAFIEVNEEGSEAAAVSTAAGVVLCDLHLIPPTTFFADHPFVFMLQSSAKTWKTILFYGKLMNPEENN